MNLPVATKKLILYIEVPGIWVDDILEQAIEFGDEVVDIILEEFMRCEVGLTIVTLPGDKAMSDDFGVHSYTCQVVGAEVVDR